MYGALELCHMSLSDAACRLKRYCVINLNRQISFINGQARVAEVVKGLLGVSHARYL